MRGYKELAKEYHRALFNLCMNICDGHTKSAMALAEKYIRGAKEEMNNGNEKNTK